MRYVLSPQGRVLVDYRHKLPGRGAYTCVNPGCLAEAVKRQQFARAFRGKADAVDGAALQQALVEQIRIRINDLLGMARKAGQAVSGSSLVLAALARPGALGLVLVAEDISPAIGEKVRRKADACGVPCIRWLDKESIGQMMGRAERSVVALRADRLASAIQVELHRFMHMVGES